MFRQMERSRRRGLLAAAVIVVLGGAFGAGVAEAAPKGSLCPVNEPVPGDVRVPVEDASSEYAAVAVDSGTGLNPGVAFVCVGVTGVGSFTVGGGLLIGGSPGGAVGATVTPNVCVQTCAPVGSGPTGAGTNAPGVVGAPPGTTTGAGAGTTQQCVMVNGTPVGNNCNQEARASAGTQTGDAPTAGNSSVCAVTLPGGGCGVYYPRGSAGTDSNDTVKLNVIGGPTGPLTPGANVPRSCVDVGTATLC